jgi:hypothetical protein
MNSDGSHPRKITDGFAPHFNVDGSALLCSRWYSVDDKHRPFARGLVVHFLNGPQAGKEYQSDPTQLKCREENGIFTPDGQQVLFDEIGGSFGIFLMDNELRNPQHLLNANATQLVMTPDGKQVFYLQANSLYSFSRKTGESHCLTSDLVVLRYALTPDGKHIILLAF